MHSQVVVLGGGPGGYAAAFMAADLGMDVTIVEADPRLGGTCLLRGCIPSKALLHVAKVISEAREMEEWGVAFGKMKLNVDTMRARKEKVIDTLTGGLAQLAKRRKVRVVNARGIFVDSQTLQLEGGDPASYDSQRLTFDHCILATGSVPAMPGMFDIGSDRVMDSTGALQLQDVPKTLLVIGGGYIGLEMGTVYAELGSKVTVVEFMDGLLPGADRDLVKPLAKRLGNLFEEIHLSTKVVGLEDAGKKVEVKMEGPETNGSFAFDRVLVSVGRRPVSSGFGLENTKVTINDRGFVVVDDQQRTSDPHIMAIGDVAGDPMLAHKASHEGKVAAEVLAGEPAAFDKSSDSCSRVHRSRNCLGRHHGRRSQTSRSQRCDSPIPLAGQRSCHCHGQNRWAYQMDCRPRDRPPARLRHCWFGRRGTDCRGRSGNRNGLHRARHCRIDPPPSHA